MQKLRSINTYFWDDSYIAGLEPPYKLLFLYLLTNPLTNLAGCYEIQVRKIVFDTGLEDGMVRNGLERFERDRKVFYRDGWIYIRNFIKNQKLNTNMKKGVTAILDAAPEWIKETIRNPSKPFETIRNGGLKYEGEVEVEGEGEAEKRNHSEPPPSERSKAGDFGEPKDKIFKYPAILALRDVTGQTPPMEAWDLLQEKLGSDIDLPLLVTSYSEWRARGYKSTNFDGIADWYLEAKGPALPPVKTPKYTEEEMAEMFERQRPTRPMPKFSM